MMGGAPMALGLSSYVKLDTNLLMVDLYLTYLAKTVWVVIGCYCLVPDSATLCCMDSMRTFPGS